MSTGSQSFQPRNQPLEVFQMLDVSFKVGTAGWRAVVPDEAYQLELDTDLVIFTKYG